MRRWLLPALLLAALIGAWQLAASTGALADVARPRRASSSPRRPKSPTSLWQSRSLLAENAWVTLREILLGLACALVAGVGFAVLMHLSGLLRDASYPLIVASQTIPIVVIAPILLVWLGFGIGPKIVVVALICFFPITVNALDGLRSADPEAIKLMRTLDASRWQIFRRVEAPTALPSFFTGAKIAVVARADRRRLRRVGRLQLRPRPPDPRRTTPTGGRAAVRGGRSSSRRWPSLLIGLLALAERRVVTWR